MIEKVHVKRVLRLLVSFGGMPGLLLFLLVLAGCRGSGDVYLFATFREPATEGLYLAWSEDGYFWHDLGGPWLKPEVGLQRVMRDPSVVRGEDGTFHMVWTSSWQGDKGFGYASSPDLINWSPQQFIPVMAFDTSTVNVWAPELFYDEENKRYVIVWASTIPFKFARGAEEERNNHRLYYTTTRDFREFSGAELFFDPGYSVIDGVLVQRTARDYVLVFKDNTRPERNIRVASGVSPLGPFGNISGPLTAPFTEGPTVLKRKGKWLIFYDAYREKKYGALETSGFTHFANISDKITLPEGHKHGTVFRAEKKMVDVLIRRSVLKEGMIHE